VAVSASQRAASARGAPGSRERVEANLEPGASHLELSGRVGRLAKQCPGLAHGEVADEHARQGRLCVVGGHADRVAKELALLVEEARLGAHLGKWQPSRARPRGG